MSSTSSVCTLVHWSGTVFYKNISTHITQHRVVVAQPYPPPVPPLAIHDLTHESFLCLPPDTKLRKKETKIRARNEPSNGSNKTKKGNLCRRRT